MSKKRRKQRLKGNKHPLRPVFEVLRSADNIFGRDRVRFACGHIGFCTPGARRGRCVKCPSKDELAKIDELKRQAATAQAQLEIKLQARRKIRDLPQGKAILVPRAIWDTMNEAERAAYVVKQAFPPGTVTPAGNQA